MTSDELRVAFFNFFEGKGHKVIPSSSLIPHGDPTLLLTSAGMVQVKPYFLGEALPPGPRLVSCQKCFRATDIELVGDATHLTFFEMLGNFSVGDYFKQEAISWAWEFVTQWLKLPPERLWISILLDDEDSFGYWCQRGIAEERILRFGEEDNFWGPVGDSGPCGPCSEIFYDFGEEVGCGRPSCAPGCDCGRFSEIWNLVFTEYNQDKDGQRTLLPKSNIDTGMGLERTAAAMQGKTSVYETELFASLIDNISKFIGKNYGSDAEVDKAMRVVVEHGRALTFLIADGVEPSNEGRGYVLRRLLRRAALFGRRLGLEKPFLNQIAGATVGTMAKVYPELQQRQDDIYRIVETEEAQFRETLNTGLERLDGIIEKASSKKLKRISGEDAFRLYDTYGFPLELTREIAVGRGFSVDLEGFEREMEKQRERAKAAQKFELAEEVVLKGELDIKTTIFTGYNNLNQETVILSLLVDNEFVETVKEGQEANLILADTPFYGEMGGQVGDTGEIRSSAGRFSVTDTVRVPPDITVHQGRVTEGSLSVGDEVEAEVDKERRLDIARNHTATHLLQAALRQVLGEHVQQRGSVVAPDRLRFDFSHLVAMTKEEVGEVQRIVNEGIRQNLAVYDEDISYKKAIEEGAIALFGEKYGDVVRVLKIGQPPISTELCGGTHVTTTGETGYFHIISEGSIGAGLRRIEAITGRGAERYIAQRLSSLESIAEYMGVELSNVLDKVRDWRIERDKERKRAVSMESALARKEAESLLDQVEVINDVNLLSVSVSATNQAVLFGMADYVRGKLKSAVVVLGAVYSDRAFFVATVTPDLVERGYNAGDIVKQVAKVAGGGGGGTARWAQASGKDKDRLDEALRLVKSLL